MWTLQQVIHCLRIVSSFGSAGMGRVRAAVVATRAVSHGALAE